MEAGERQLRKVLFDMMCVDGEINSNGRQFASASANRTPELTPSGSPKRTPLTLPPRGRSAAVSPTLQAVKGPLKWHSSSDGRLSLYQITTRDGSTSRSMLACTCKIN